MVQYGARIRDDESSDNTTYSSNKIEDLVASSVPVPKESIATAATQANHGFVGYEPIYFDGSLWKPALANDSATLKHGIAADVNGDDFYAVHYGIILGAHGFTPGLTYFVSDTQAGINIPTPPTATNRYQQATFEVIDSIRIKVIDQFVIKTSSGTSGASASITDLMATIENLEQRIEELEEQYATHWQTSS